MYRKKTIAVVTFCLILVVGSAFWYVKNRSNSVAVVPQNGLTEEQTKQQVAADLGNKQQSIQQNSEPSSTPTTKNIELSAKQEANGTVTIFTKIIGYTSGSCDLKVANNGKSFQQTVEVIFQPEYSTCAGYSVPVSELGVGEWNIDLTVGSNGQTTNKTLTFRVQ